MEALSGQPFQMGYNAMDDRIEVPPAARVPVMPPIRRRAFSSEAGQETLQRAGLPAGASLGLTVLALIDAAMCARRTSLQPASSTPPRSPAAASPTRAASPASC